MADSKKERKSESKISELILSAKSLSLQIERQTREKFLSEKVVDLDAYRAFRKAHSQKRVLVIDDDSELKDSLRKALEKNGYVPLFADGLERLAEIMETIAFDLVLIDPGLSWVDAFEFCRLMKGNKFLREIPIIFISRAEDKKEIRQAFENGCDEYIDKSVKLDRLVRTIRYFLENY